MRDHVTLHHNLEGLRERIGLRRRAVEPLAVRVPDVRQPDDRRDELVLQQLAVRVVVLGAAAMRAAIRARSSGVALLLAERIAYPLRLEG